MEARDGDDRVAAFDSIYDATTSYIHTLNTARAYKKLRDIRHSQRSRQETLRGYTLASGLENYSVLGDEYIANLRIIMSRHYLGRLDTAPMPQYTPVSRIVFSRKIKTS